jgi:hypothetical protein
MEQTKAGDVDMADAYRSAFGTNVKSKLKRSRHAPGTGTRRIPALK